MPADIEDLAVELRELCGSFDRALKDAGDDEGELEEKVWAFYSRLERVAAKMKLRLSIEQPPELVSRTPSKETSAQFLGLASSHLKEAAVRLESGDHPALLRAVQGARNGLRSYLSERSRIRTNEVRAKRRATRSRSAASSS